MPVFTVFYCYYCYHYNVNSLKKLFCLYRISHPYHQHQEMDENLVSQFKDVSK